MKSGKQLSSNHTSGSIIFIPHSYRILQNGPVFQDDAARTWAYSITHVLPLCCYPQALFPADMYNFPLTRIMDVKRWGHMLAQLHITTGNDARSVNVILGAKVSGTIFKLYKPHVWSLVLPPFLTPAICPPEKSRPMIPFFFFFLSRMLFFIEIKSRSGNCYPEIQ